MREMCMIGTPDAEDSAKRVEACSMVGVSKSSFAEEFKILYEDGIITKCWNQRIIIEREK